MSTQIMLIIIGTILLSFVAGALLMWIYQRRRYEQQLARLSDLLNRMIAGPDDVDISANEDILLSKIYHQLQKLREITEGLREAGRKDKEEIRHMIAETAHQLRTPLANMTSYLELLEEPGLSPEESRLYLDALHQTEEKLKFLVEGFIKMSRLEQQIIQVRKEQTDLWDTIDKAKTQAKPLAKRKDITIHTDIKDPGIHVPHDGNWLGEAIFNILDNAVKYSPEGSVIELGVTVNEMFTVIYVRDYGAGIQKGEEQEIFTRFYRGSSVTTQPGLGIGLYIAREIVLRHGGFMKAVRKEKGLLMHIYLPRC